MLKKNGWRDVCYFGGWIDDAACGGRGNNLGKGGARDGFIVVAV